MFRLTNGNYFLEASRSLAKKEYGLYAKFANTISNNNCPFPGWRFPANVIFVVFSIFFTIVLKENTANTNFVGQFLVKKSPPHEVQNGFQWKYLLVKNVSSPLLFAIFCVLKGSERRLYNENNIPREFPKQEILVIIINIQ